MSHVTGDVIILTGAHPKSKINFLDQNELHNFIRSDLVVILVNRQIDDVNLPTSRKC